jgi:hypothetical protein
MIPEIDAQKLEKVIFWSETAAAKNHENKKAHFPTK